MRVGVYVAILGAIAFSTVGAQGGAANTAPMNGDIWAEPALGSFVKAANATVYVWPDNAAVKQLFTSACAAAKISNNAWLVARTEFDSPTGISYSDTVTRDIGIIRAIAELPHATATADSLGHFAFAHIPYGKYMLEAETMMKGALVQWWTEADVTRTQILLTRLLKGGTAESAGYVKLGPREVRRAQFCIAEEHPGIGLSVFLDDKLPQIAGRVYRQGEVDRPVGVISSGPKSTYPDSLSKIYGQQRVELEFTVTERGYADMKSIRVIRSAAPALTELARDIVNRMIFRPAMLRDTPVATIVQQSVDFNTNP